VINQPTIIKSPLVIMFRDEAGGVICHLHPGKSDDYKRYGLLVCDLVRHVAKCFDVDEDDVWECVERERENPTTTVTAAS
jgi:hypothetical protein